MIAGYKIEEEVLVAEHEDDDDHWSGGAHPVDHYHCVSHKWRRVITIMMTQTTDI